jgi:hypothetical protein
MDADEIRWVVVQLIYILWPNQVPNATCYTVSNVNCPRTAHRTYRAIDKSLYIWIGRVSFNS